LDRVLSGQLPQYSRSRLQGLIRGGLVWVNGEAVTKTGRMLLPGAAIEVRVPETAFATLTAQSIPLEVIFENSDVIVVNKPAGMVVHPGAGNRTGTLVNAALAHDPSMRGIGGEVRPGVVHRLDKGTSGLIVLAKSDEALKWLQAQFQERTVQKTYLALVEGRPPSTSGRIEAAIGRDPSHRKQMSVLPAGRGRSAETEFQTLEAFPEHTLLELHPATGRTHQIRLHCALVGCPIVGDTVYGRRNPSLAMDRHFLHAWKLAVILPGEEHRRLFVADLPDELEQVLGNLRAGAKAA
jgi:23S rRNA pseudouridine1911/1915/1917 synthase